MSDDDREEISEEQFDVIRAVTGLEAEDFKRSKVGRYIFDRIDMDIENFTAQLLATNPRDVDKCIEIRNDILVREKMILFVDEAIASGRNAEENLAREAQQVY